MFERLLKIQPSSKHSLMILGPRGTGKTYWLKKSFPNALYFDLLKMDTYQQFLANPSMLEERIPSHHKDWIIIDEIQKIPALLNEVHRLIESKNLRFIVTGSSARNLRKKGVNLLAGRALTRHMYPLTTTELGKQFSLKTSLKYGNLPSVYNHENPEDYLKSYIQTYLREEVLQEGLTRNLALFSKFLEVASFSQGEILNYTNIAQEVGSNRHTITNYFEILEDLLIAYRIPCFQKRAKRDMVSHPKFYFFDVGVYRSLRPQGPLDSESVLDGAAIETLFLQEAMAINSYFDLGYQSHYWRTQSKIEVDFVLYGKNGLIAVETKRKRNLKSADFKGLREFSKDYPMAKCYLLYGGSERYFSNDIEAIPFETALKELKELISK